MSHHLQLIPGTVTEALDWNARRHGAWGSYRLVLTLDDLQPGGTYELVGTWAKRLDPARTHAVLAELGVVPAVSDRRPAR